MNSRLNITHVIPFLGIAQGGPVHALAHQLHYQANDYNITLHASSLQVDGPNATFPESITTYTSRTIGALGYRWCPQMRQILKQQTQHIDILHSHLIWTDCHRHAAAISKKFEIPHLISPCGTLNKDALAYRAPKKKFIGSLYQSEALKQAACIHAKSEQEINDIRAYGITKPVALMPNIIPYSGNASPTDIENYIDQFKLSSQKKRLLYMGRIHPVKGLSRLIKAWSQLQDYHNEWDLVIAGPNEDNFRSVLEADIEKLQIPNSSIHFVGMLEGKTKWAALHEAELFTLPSDFENFGSALAEAAAAGTPIIASQGTPWKQLIEANAGWWVKTTPEALKKAIEEAFSIKESTLKQMGVHAQQLVSNSTPDRICQQWQQLYLWLLKQEEKPDFVFTD